MSLAQLLTRFRRFWTPRHLGARLVRDRSPRAGSTRCCASPPSPIPASMKCMWPSGRPRFSYSSLLALGPLIAMPCSSRFRARQQDPELAARGLTAVISFIAPQVAHTTRPPPATGSSPTRNRRRAPRPLPRPTPRADAPPPDPEMVQIINQFHFQLPFESAASSPPKAIISITIRAYTGLPYNTA